MSQCSLCLPFHEEVMHHCSKGLEAIDPITKEPMGYPKVGDGKCPDKDYTKQGQRYCPSECYDCKEMDPKAMSEDCVKGVEEYETIAGKKFYTGRPKDKKCPDFDPINPPSEMEEIP